MGHDLEPGFEGVVAFDQFEMRLAAVEQGGEQASEMGVHLGEGIEQARAAFAVEAADRAAQAVDRLLQIVALSGASGARFLEFGKLGFGDEVDRAETLALGDEAVKGDGFLVGRGKADDLEAELFGQERWRTSELFTADAGIFSAAQFLVLGASDRPGAAFTRGSKGFAGVGERLGDSSERVFGLALGGGGGGARCFGCGRPGFERGDLGGERRGLRREVDLFPGQRVASLGSLREAGVGDRPAPPPLARLARGGGQSFAGRGGFAGAGGGLGALVRDRLAGGGRGCPRAVDLGAKAGGIGQRGEVMVGGRDGIERGGKQRGEIGAAVLECCAVGVEAVERGDGGIFGAGGLAAVVLGDGSGGARLFGGVAVGFDGGGGLVAGRGGMGHGAGEARKIGVDRGEAVGADKSLGRRRTAADRDEAVPAADDPVAGDEALAGEQWLSVVALGDSDLGEAAVELGRGADLGPEGSEAGCEHGVGDLGFAAVPATRAGAADVGLEVVPERRREGAFVARVGGDPGQCRAAAAMVERADQRGSLGIGGGKRGAGGGDYGFTHVALLDRAGATGFSLNERGFGGGEGGRRIGEARFGDDGGIAMLGAVAKRGELGG